MDSTLFENSRLETTKIDNSQLETTQFEINENDDSFSNVNMINKTKCETIILDFSLVQFVDEAGTKCLQKIIKEYKKQNTDILFTNLNGNIVLQIF